MAQDKAANTVYGWLQSLRSAQNERTYSATLVRDETRRLSQRCVCQTASTFVLLTFVCVAATRPLFRSLLRRRIQRPARARSSAAPTENCCWLSTCFSLTSVSEMQLPKSSRSSLNRAHWRACQQCRERRKTWAKHGDIRAKNRHRYFTDIWGETRRYSISIFGHILSIFRPVLVGE